MSKPTKEEMLITLTSIIDEEVGFLRLDGEETSDTVEALKAIRSIVESWPRAVKREEIEKVVGGNSRPSCVIFDDSMGVPVADVVADALKNLGIPVED